jgi:hypothetical protein
MICSEGIPIWNLQSCVWSCPETTASTGGKCFPLDASSTDVVKQTCSAATDVTACAPAMCFWKIAAVPSGETPLFTKEFCHPAEINPTAVEDFAKCLIMSPCGGYCVLSNGKALIPDKDFCAPAMMTDDVQTIASCIDI